MARGTDERSTEPIVRNRVERREQREREGRRRRGRRQYRDGIQSSGRTRRGFLLF